MVEQSSNMMNYFIKNGSTKDYGSGGGGGCLLDLNKIKVNKLPGSNENETNSNIKNIENHEINNETNNETNNSEIKIIKIRTESMDETKNKAIT